MSMLLQVLQNLLEREANERNATERPRRANGSQPLPKAPDAPEGYRRVTKGLIATDDLFFDPRKNEIRPLKEGSAEFLLLVGKVWVSQFHGVYRKLLSPPAESLAKVPEGWEVITTGEPRIGDCVWDTAKQQFDPVDQDLLNTFHELEQDVRDLHCLIRRKGSN